MLSPALKGMLDNCAQLMSTGREDRNLNFFNFQGELRKLHDECVAHLAAALEKLTKGQRTVRPADHSAFAQAPMGISNLFMVICDSSTPAGRVMNPTDAMDLYIIAPGSDLGCARFRRNN